MAVASITADTTTLAVGATANVTIALTGPGPTGGAQMAVTWQGPAASALVLADGTSLAATPQPAEVDVAGTSQVTFAVTLSQAVAVNPGDVLITFTASLQGAGRQLDLRAA